MKLRRSPLIAVAIAILAGAWVASGQIGERANGADHTAAPPPQPSAAPPVAVRVRELVARQREQTVTITGRTAASRSVEVRAETEGQVAELLVQRGQVVRQGDVIARLRLDDRTAKLAEAKAVLRQREIEHEAAAKLHERGFRSTTEQAGAQARLDAARAVVEQMEVDIARTTLRAPFAGIVGAGHVEVGDFVRVGDVAATIIDLNPALAVGSLSERQIGALSIGARATVTLIDGARHTGVVSFIAPVADPQTRTYRVELQIANADYAVRDGLTAEIRFSLGQERAHFVSPSVLTLNDAGLIGVRTLDDDDIVHFQPVTLLADEPQGVWIGGLPERVRVIVVGQEFVVEGERVTPVVLAPADNSS